MLGHRLARSGSQPVRSEEWGVGLSVSHRRAWVVRDEQRGICCYGLLYRQHKN
jgi:hypothetical protein